MLSETLRSTEAWFDALRRREFARLDEQGCAYLDYTGSALYGRSQVEAQAHILAGSVFGNPHSHNPPSQRSADLIASARRATLAWFGVDEDTHTVCFVANASAAIKLVAESYPFSPRLALALSADNHNSINGVREYARRAGASLHLLPLDAQLRLDDPLARLRVIDGAGLLAYPAQSNFSGVRHPLALVGEARKLGWDVLLDAAAFASSGSLDLRTCPATFTAISYYKLFGLPTGLGALIAEREALARLRRPWFAGGTVDYASVQLERHQLSTGPAAFEDGTPDFLGLAMVETGFDFLREIGPARLRGRLARLTTRFLDGLASLRHGDGSPLVRVHGPSSADGRGANVAFSVLDTDGRPMPFDQVERRAGEAGVAVRGGCFCNPGAAESAFGFEASATARCLDALDGAFSIPRFAHCLGPGIAVGAIRASFGAATNEHDLHRGLEVMATFADARTSAGERQRP